MPKTLFEFAVEKEGTPGTAETIVEADVLTRVRNDVRAEPDIEMQDLDEASAVSTFTAAVAGRKMISFPVSYNLRGPGDLTTAPTVADMFEAAVFSGAAAETIAIGAITTGPYVAGEIITQSTSNATGIVLQQIATGTSPIAYIPISGTMVTTETLTGSISGATCTTSAGPVDGGYGWRPNDWEDSDGTEHHATCKLFRDGFYWTGRGCLAGWQIVLTNGGPGVVTQNFSGAWSAYGDAALFGVSAYPEDSIIVPKFLNASISVGTYQPTGIREVTIDFPNTIEAVEDANDTAGDGILYMDYRRQLPTIRLAVDQVATSTKNYFSELQAGTTQRFECTLGSASGARWTFSSRAAQLRSVTPAEQSPRRAMFEVEFGLTGTGNEELMIWQH
jgi:hypothetical protein